MLAGRTNLSASGGTNIPLSTAVQILLEYLVIAGGGGGASNGGSNGGGGGGAG